MLGTHRTIVTVHKTVAEWKAKGFRILLLRGVLGGALGGFVWAALRIFLELDRFGSTWAHWLFIGYIFGIPGGVLLGALIATVVWLLHRLSGKDLGPAIRAILGISIAFIPWLVSWLLDDRTGFVPTPWQYDVMDAVRFAGALGGVAAIIVGRQRSEETNPHQ